jgi:general secretion pathway protein I
MMRRVRGFTLVEVLVALAIVTIGMAALLSALSSSADSVSYQRDKTLAEWVALNRIEEVRLATQRPKVGKNDGEAEMAGQKWKWSQEVLETEVKGILRVDVSVRPAQIGGDKDANWYTTVSGIIGDALALPRGDMDPYGVPMQPGPGGQGGNGGNENGNQGNQRNNRNPEQQNPPPPPPPDETNQD